MLTPKGQPDLHKLVSLTEIQLGEAYKYVSLLVGQFRKRIFDHNDPQAMMDAFGTKAGLLIDICDAAVRGVNEIAELTNQKTVEPLMPKGKSATRNPDGSVTLTNA